LERKQQEADLVRQRLQQLQDHYDAHCAEFEQRLDLAREKERQLITVRGRGRLLLMLLLLLVCFLLYRWGVFLFIVLFCVVLFWWCFFIAWMFRFIVHFLLCISVHLCVSILRVHLIFLCLPVCLSVQESKRDLETKLMRMSNDNMSFHDAAIKSLKLQHEREISCLREELTEERKRYAPTICINVCICECLVG
jgi:hypothetical protein